VNNSNVALRDSLIAELNQAIAASAGQPIKGQLPAHISRLLNRIQKVNEQANAEAKAIIGDMLDQQDALAEKVFGQHQSGPELAAEISALTASIDDFAERLSIGSYYYAAA
jgi:uncharacterized coiled-coil protein SlyX